MDLPRCTLGSVQIAKSSKNKNRGAKNPSSSQNVRRVNTNTRNTSRAPRRRSNPAAGLSGNPLGSDPNAAMSPNSVPDVSPAGNPPSHSSAAVLPNLPPATLPEPLAPMNYQKMHEHEAYQISMAQHLSSIGVTGPYEIGDYLCDIVRATGHITKLAVREVLPDGQQVWRDLRVGSLIAPRPSLNICGRPAATSSGALLWMEDETGKVIRPEWMFFGPLAGRFNGSWSQKVQDKGESPADSGLKPGYDPVWYDGSLSSDDFQ
ncbi:hypothetical protein FDECE_8501 [Fusarium decemcellulare]|nr:hypothetical protein FDECE_8501 [Fusarium decemcellulare]